MRESKARPSWGWVGLFSIRQGKPCIVEKTGLAYLLLRVALAVKQRWTSPACHNSLPLRKISSKVATSPQVRTWIYFYVWLAVQCHIFPLDIMYKLNISLCSSSSLLLYCLQRARANHRRALSPIICQPIETQGMRDGSFHAAVVHKLPARGNQVCKMQFQIKM